MAHPIERMHKTGAVSERQYIAFLQLQFIVFKGADVGHELGRRDTKIDGTLLRHGYVERMVTVEAALELATMWAKRIPSPVLLHRDMILGREPMTTIAQRHGLNWRTARKRFIAALDLWADMAEQKFA